MQRSDLPLVLQRSIPNLATLVPPLNPRSGQVWLRAHAEEGEDVPHTLMSFVRYNWEVCKCSDWNFMSAASKDIVRTPNARPLLQEVANNYIAALEWREEYVDVAHAIHPLLGFALYLSPGSLFPDDLPRIEASLYVNVSPTQRHHLDTCSLVGYAPAAVEELRARAQQWCSERSTKLLENLLTTL